MSRTASFTDFAPAPAARAEYTLTFGKHKGLPLSEIDRGYLEWLLEQDLSRRPGLEDAILADLARRGKAIVAQEKPRDRWTAPSRHDELTMELALMIVEAGTAALKEQLGADMRFVMAYSFLKEAVQNEPVIDGPLAF
jgi:hypothetical protein